MIFLYFLQKTCAALYTFGVNLIKNSFIKVRWLWCLVIQPKYGFVKLFL